MNATAFRPEEILGHTEWLRNLARHLVWHSDVANDVVQETWEASLRHDVPAGEGRRPWLATVARNFARRTWRSETRRERWERLADGGEGTAPSPEELIERADAFRLLADVVKDLAEPVRATVLMRYFEGLSSAEIARRLAVPAGTVRWRLKQGLDELRQRLDARHGGDRRKWVLMLLPLAGAAPAWAMATGLVRGFGRRLVAGAGVGAAVMLLVGLFAGLGVISGLLADGDSHGTRERTTAHASSQHGGGGAMGSSDPAGSPTGQATTIASVPGGLLTVRVEDLEGGPVAGASVKLEPGPGAIGRSLGVTDRNGLLRLGPEAGIPERGDLSALAPGYAETFARFATPGEARVRLMPQSVVSGIVARDGVPIAEAEVALGSGFGRPKTATTDSEGRFTLASLPAGLYRLEASADELWGQHPERISLGLGRVLTGIRIDVGRGFAVSGRVHLAGSPPPKGTTLRVDERSVPLAADGRFRTVGLGPGAHRLQVHGDGGGNFFLGLGPGKVEVEIRDRDLEQDIDLGPRHTLAFELKDERGLAVTGQSILVEIKLGETLYGSGCDTDQGGRCQLESLPAGSSQVSVGGAGAGARAVEIPAPGPVKLVVPRFASLAGRILTEDGRPVRPRLVRLGDYSGQSDLNGRFRFRNVSPGTYPLVVRASRASSDNMNIIKDGLDETEITRSIALQPGQDVADLVLTLPPEDASLSGIVLEGDGSPATDVIVTLQPHEGCDESWERFEPTADLTVTDTVGRFRFDGLTRGSTPTIVAYRSNGEQSVAACVPAGTSNATLTLRRLATLEVTVVGASDVVASLRLAVVSPEGRTLGWLFWPEGNVKSRSDLPAGPAKVRAVPRACGDDSKALAEADVVLRPGVTNRVTLTLP